MHLLCWFIGSTVHKDAAGFLSVHSDNCKIQHRERIMFDHMSTQVQKESDNIKKAVKKERDRGGGK